MLNTKNRWSIKNNFKRKYGWTRDRNQGNIDMVAIYEKAIDSRVKQTPGGFIAVCPFPDHDDSTPSFVMYPDTQSYFCFGCNRSGKASWFRKEMERIYGIR